MAIPPLLNAVLRIIVVTGNILYFLWILYNGINEGFQATPIEKVSYIGIMILLLVNASIILSDTRRKELHHP